VKQSDLTKSADNVPTLLLYAKATGTEVDRDNLCKCVLAPIIEAHDQLNVSRLLGQVATYKGVLTKKYTKEPVQYLPVVGADISPWRRIDFAKLIELKDVADGIRPAAGEEFEMGKPSALTSFLIWARSQLGDSLTGKHIIFWGHGSGWGGTTWRLLLGCVFDFKKTPFYVHRGKLLPTNFELLETFLEKIEAIESNFSLQPKELSAALGAALEGEKLGLVGFHSCLMGTVEVAYDLREVATHMMASPDFVAYNEFPYAKWLSALELCNAQNAFDFARPLFKILTDNPPKREHQRATLIVVKLSKIEGVVNCINNFAKTAIADKSDDLRQHLLRIRNDGKSCLEYGGAYARTVDIAQFFSALTADKSFAPAERNGYAKLNELATDLVHAARESIELTYRSPTSQDAAPLIPGLTVFFPKSLADAKDTYSFQRGWYEKDSSSSSFVDATAWRSFLGWLWREDEY
jgi:hypothetical protein